MPLAHHYRTASEQIRAFTGQYKQHLSAGSMVAGFSCDYMLLGPVDVLKTQLIVGAYILVAALAIALLHFLENREGPAFLQRWRNLFPMGVQFALGSVWSGLLVFYSRSAVVASSWPFLLLLLAIFIGNEVFHHYVARLVFSATLLFFALFSFSVLVVPIYVHAIGTWVFLLSGLIALLIFGAYLRGLDRLGPVAFGEARWKILGGALSVFALINLFYFTNVLPPLPLALAASGAYHSVAKTGDVYVASEEAQSWWTRFGFAPTLHLQPGEPAYVYSSVFAPIALNTQIQHRWEWYSPKRKKWLFRGAVAFHVTGGRNGGYRGYTLKHNPAPGEWRVDIATMDGHLIGRVRFDVEEAAAGGVILAPITIR
jgi:hypothetical protein